MKPVSISRASAWFLFLALLVYLSTVGWLASNDQGHFTVTINGQNIEGVPKYFIGSIGAIFAAIVAVLAFGTAAIALAGSSLIIFASLGLAALILIALALPFLLPIVIPVAVVVAVILALRQTKQNNVT